MELIEEINKNLKCCLSSHEHIVKDPLMLPCSGNVCRTCAIGSNENCRKCCRKHEYRDSSELPPSNISTELLIKVNLKYLFEELKNDVIEKVMLDKDSDIEQFIVNHFVTVNEAIYKRAHQLKNIISDLADETWMEAKKSMTKIKEATIKDLEAKRQAFLDKIQSNIEIENEDTFYEYQENLKKLKEEYEQFRAKVSKIKFVPNISKIGKCDIGELFNSFSLKNQKIKFTTENSIHQANDAENLAVHQDSQQMFITASSTGKVIIANLSGAYSRELDTGPKFSKPKGICCCKQTNEIYVGDNETHFVHVFNAYSLRQTNIISNKNIINCDAIAVDYEVSTSGVGMRTLYICDSSNSKVSIINAENGNFIKSLSMKGPIDVKVKKGKCYVLCNNNTCSDFDESSETASTSKRLRKSLFSLRVFHKESFEVLDEFEFDTLFDVCGLQVNEFFNEIYFFGYELCNSQAAASNRRVYNLFVIKDDLLVRNSRYESDKILNLDEETPVKDITWFDDKLVVLKENYVKILNLEFNK